MYIAVWLVCKNLHLSQIKGSGRLHLLSFHVPFLLAYMLTQSSSWSQLLGSFLCQFVYGNGAPVTLDTNVPSTAASVPSMYVELTPLTVVSERNQRPNAMKCVYIRTSWEKRSFRLNVRVTIADNFKHLVQVHSQLRVRIGDFMETILYAINSG